jgi:signal peptidase I
MASRARKTGDLGQVRDLVESVYVAIVLAFVLRAFMIEAFVIPTGSMATSIYGEHFVLTCPACDYEYAYGRTGESSEGRVSGQNLYTPTAAVCPNCGYGYTNDDPAKPPRGGDRVMVLKYLYDFGSAQPWDVVVFKNPQTNREKYIKRLIGLPGETIEIVNGDIFVTSPGESQPHIRRKPLSVQEALWQVMYDNDYPPDPELFASADGGGTPPWPGWQQGLGGAAWATTDQGGRELTFGGSDQPARLEYRPGRYGFAPYSGYNAENAGTPSLRSDPVCTDWKLQAVLTPQEEGPSQLAMVFESYEHRFRAEFDTSGQVRLLHQRRDADAWDVWGQADVGQFEPGQGRIVALAAADFRVSVHIDGKEVLATTDEQLPSAYEHAVQRTKLRELARVARDTEQSRQTELSRLERTSRPTAEQQARLQTLRKEVRDLQTTREDLEQRLIWSQQPAVYMEATGRPLSLLHVRLMRDLYYTSPYVKLPDAGDAGPQFAYVRAMLHSTGAPGGPNTWRQHEGRYLGWGVQGNPIRLRDAENDDLDEFFCLGDNSPTSHDGRTWMAAAPSLRLFDEDGEMIYKLGTVPRYNMLGRAMLVYWPAGYDLPILGLPLVPNVGEMRLVR